VFNYINKKPMQQFFYVRKEPVLGTEPIEFTEFIDSFNIDKVIRTISMEDGRRLVLLDDIHERVTQVPVINHKTNVIKNYQKERGTYQSEIYLTSEDSERFIKMLQV
jgi:hypothetical protein